MKNKKVHLSIPESLVKKFDRRTPKGSNRSLEIEKLMKKRIAGYKEIDLDKIKIMVKSVRSRLQAPTYAMESHEKEIVLNDIRELVDRLYEYMI